MRYVPYMVNRVDVGWGALLAGVGGVCVSGAGGVCGVGSAVGGVGGVGVCGVCSEVGAW